jgi:hypothetical protein
LQSYPGGKGKGYQKIINLIPPHAVYIETHLGSGIVMRRKRPALLNIGIDRNSAVLRETASVFPAAIVIPGDAEASLLLTMGAAIVRNGDDDEDAVSPKITMPAPIARNDDAGPQFYLFAGDALNILRQYPFKGNEFVYADPPYLLHTRRSRKAIYKYEYTEQDHIGLLAHLKRLPCPVMISGYWSELYADTLAGWRTYTYTAQTRAGTQAEEWLWMNYPEPTALHDYRYLGDNFRERERIKRKKERWVKRLRKMDVLERRAVLWAIREAGVI